MQSKPPANCQPTPCGRPDWPAHGRGPSQLGWYEFIAERCPRTVVLDYGAGVGAGAAYLEWLEAGPVVAFDPDPAMERFGVRTTLDEGRKYGTVVCIDVIEHIVEDLTFFEELKSRALHRLYITTPNLTVSRCQNPHHAREYTFAEFVELFQPDELWGGTADGWLRTEIGYEPTIKWVPSTVGAEFPSICGVFYV